MWGVQHRSLWCKMYRVSIVLLLYSICFMFHFHFHVMSSVVCCVGYAASPILIYEASKLDGFICFYIPLCLFFHFQLFSCLRVPFFCAEHTSSLNSVDEVLNSCGFICFLIVQLCPISSTSHFYELRCLWVWRTQHRSFWYKRWRISTVSFVFICFIFIFQNSHFC